MNHAADHYGEIQYLPESWIMKNSFWVTVRVLGFLLAPILAATITLGLFYFMHTLIASGERIDNNVRVIKIVDATMPEVEMVVIEEIDKPEPIVDVSDQQPEVVNKEISLDTGPALNIARAAVDLDTSLDLTVATISATDGDYLPLVAFPAEYPARARRQDIEGWCIVSFTVNGQGNVVEETIRVVDSEPPEIFDRVSVRAASRFRFQPRVKNGVGVDVPGVQYLFKFEFED